MLSEDAQWSEIEVEPTAGRSIVAAIFQKHNFGVAYFDADSSEIKILEDLAEYDGLHILSQLLYETEASKLLLGTSTPVEVFQRLKRSHDQLELLLRPGRDFNTDRGLIAIGRFTTQPRPSNVQKCPLALACFSALYKFMVEDGSADSVLGVDWCSLSCFMSIDIKSLYALSIFSEQSHPNRQCAVKKDGLSIFRLMNRTSSGAGRRLLRSWSMRPLMEPSEIVSRQEMIATLMKPSMQQLCKELHRLLTKIPNMKHVLGVIRKAPTGAAFASLLGFCSAALGIIDSISQLGQESLLFKKLCEGNSELLQSLKREIERHVDFDESRVVNRVVVKPRVDPRLDELREFYATLPEYLSQQAQEVSEHYAGLAIDTLSIVYFPQIGFLLTVPITDEYTAEYLAEHMELQFATSKFAYLKDSKARGIEVEFSYILRLELDQTIGDIHSTIVDIEVEIVLGLQVSMIDIQEQLIAYAEHCAELDCILSLAEFSREFHLVRPQILDEPIIDIKSGRHLLAELTNDAFVPNDCHLDSVVILTGPNSSGKSVFMKQVGIIVHLAHIGCFVPAGEGTRVGLVDKILVRINDEDSLRKGESAFACELRQAMTILEEATSRSLILIDEFGKGTGSGDGIGLFGALVRWLAEHGAPRTIAITHFHEMYQKTLIPRDCVKWWSMRVMQHDNDIECFLYQVIEEVCSNSHGLYCARLAGLPESVINRASELKAMYDADIPPADLRFARIDPRIEQEAMVIIRDYFQ